MGAGRRVERLVRLTVVVNSRLPLEISLDALRLRAWRNVGATLSGQRR
jgi:hypothetical protein